jgi:esterase/lipase superfamily enzyme
MQVEHHRWWSPHLNQEMELHVYGYYGKPVLVFPAQGGRCHEFADFGMLAAISGFVEAGQVKVFTVDSVDGQSWANYNAHPAERARRHEDYDRYITREVAPFISKSCAGTEQKFLTTGCSMGGYHAANFFFRHPDIFDAMISLSGLFQLRMFLGDYMDEAVYFNSPLHYLQNLSDAWYLDRYRQEPHRGLRRAGCLGGGYAGGRLRAKSDPGRQGGAKLDGYLGLRCQPRLALVAEDAAARPGKLPTSGLLAVRITPLLSKKTSGETLIPGKFVFKRLAGKERFSGSPAIPGNSASAPRSRHIRQGYAPAGSSKVQRSG